MQSSHSTTQTKVSIRSLGTVSGFIAYDIVKRLQDAKHSEILGQLASGVSATDGKRGKLHEVFEPSFDMRACLRLAFINQKLDYIHNNPLAKKWSLASTPIDYVHSSAQFYETGQQGFYPVHNFIDFIDSY